MTDFKVQRGTEVFGASSASTTVTLDTAVDPDRAFPFLSASHHSGSGRNVTDATVLNNDDLGALITGWDGTEFTLTRAAGGESVDHRYEWQVWEDQTPDQAADGWYFRGMKTTTLNTNDNNVLTGVYSDIVDYEKCIPIILAVRGGATDRRWGEMRANVQMVATDQVRIKRDTLSDVTRLQIVVGVLEFGSAWTIKQNLVAAVLPPSSPGVPTYTDLSGCGSDLPWANKFFFWSFQCADGLDGMREFGPVAFPTDADTIRIRVDPSATSYSGNAFFVAHVAYHPLMNVEHVASDNDLTLLVNGDEADTTMEGSYNVDNLGLIASTANSGNRGYPGAHWTWRILNGTTIRWRRGRTGPSPMSFGYQAIQFPVISAGPLRWCGVGSSAGGVTRSAGPGWRT